MNFLNNLSKTTTDVIGAILAIIIFWVGIQYFINPDTDMTQEYKEINTQVQEIKE